MAVYVENRNLVYGTKTNNARCSDYKIKNSEPIDYEFSIQIPTLTLSSSCKCSHKLKLRFTTQSNVKDVVLEADEVNITSDNGTEVIFYSKASITAIMSFSNDTPMEKIVKVCLEDHANGKGRTLCYSKFDLANVINESIFTKSKTVSLDICLSQNIGLMRLSVM